MTVYVLFQEISDQMGTSEIVGVYSSKELAVQMSKVIRTNRIFIREVPLDQPPAKSSRNFQYVHAD